MNDIKSDSLNQMILKAKAVLKSSYSPYSRFKVGACLRTADENLYVGCNFENAAYSLTQCAEASAIGTMISAGERQILEVVIVGSSEQPCTPCGACRQRIAEFASPDILIHMFGVTQTKLTLTLGELLPHSFGPETIENSKK